MADNSNRTTYVRETEKTSGGGMAFIVGGLVVAVAVVAWLVFGGSPSTVGTAPDAGTTTNVTVEQPAAPAPATTQGAADPVAPAPADAAPAGTTGTTAGN